MEATPLISAVHARPLGHTVNTSITSAKAAQANPAPWIYATQAFLQIKKKSVKRKYRLEPWIQGHDLLLNPGKQALSVATTKRKLVQLH